MRIAPIGLAMTAAAFLIASCDRTPTTPSIIAGAVQPPPPPRGVFDIRLEVIGPRSVAPGATAQFNAIMHRSDNTTQDVTSTAVWRSFRTNVVTMAANGVATGVGVGDTFIQASVSSRNGTREVIVTPGGTFRLVGKVVESDSATTPIAGAQVEVVGTPGASSATDFFGQYRLYGVSTNQIRITKPGYVARLENLIVTDHQTQNFTLSWANPRPDIAGAYTLTIALAEQCQSSYPAETFSRTYRAVVSQSGPALKVTVEGATLAVDGNGRGNWFSGRVEPGQIVFSVGYPDPSYYYYYDGYPAIVEEITPSLYYMVLGKVVIASATPNRLTGALDGAITTTSRNPQGRVFPPDRRCSARDHQFVLSR